MDPISNSKYVTLKIDPSARQEAARLAYALTGAASRRVSQSAAIRIACKVALKHLDESVSAIGESETDR